MKPQLPTHIEIHILKAPPPSNANRGEDNMPKTMEYGNSTRWVLSSQSQKAAVRDHYGQYSSEYGLDRKLLATRSKQHYQIVTQHLQEMLPSRETSQIVLMAKLAIGLLNSSPEKLFASLKKAESPNLVFLSGHEVYEIAQVCAEHCDFLCDLSDRADRFLALEGNAEAEKAFDEYPTKKELRSLTNELIQRVKGAPLGDVALFGRMMASLSELTVDGCIQMGFAISVNTAPRSGFRSDKGYQFCHGTPDFFSAVDDLAAIGEAQSAHIGHRVFASPVYYQHASLCLSELTNLVGSQEIAQRMAAAFIHSFSMQLPTGFQNATAHQCVPDLVLLRRRHQAPITFAPAFECPIEQSGGIVGAAAKRLIQYEQNANYVFGMDTAQRSITGMPGVVGDAAVPLDQAIAEVLEG